MTDRTWIKVLATALAVVSLTLVGISVASIAEGDEPTGNEIACTDGRWTHATLQTSDGPLRSSVHADLSEGDSLVDSVEVYDEDHSITTSDRGVESSGDGKLTVVCVAPTH